MNSNLNSKLSRTIARITITLAVIALTIVCGPAGITNFAAADDAAMFASTQPRPIDFALKDLRGRVTKLSDLRGHPVIVDFWATWCGPCRKQIPELKAIYKHYQSRGLIVIGVACDTVMGDGVKAIEPFVKEMKIPYPILLADEALVDKLDLQYIPITYFVSADGTVLSRVLGASHRGELTESARAL
ncbi:MAG: TlpA family protein disulfide reductase, partial [Candidatus Binatales bacterium]